MTAPQRPASNSTARKRAEERTAENDAPTFTREDMARAWWEGHTTYQRLGPDGCKCAAWNASECGCGLYGSNVVTPNPYRVIPAGSSAS